MYTLTRPTGANNDLVSAILYEKCKGCHLFLEPLDEFPGFFAHLHRGTPEDEALDESHAPQGSGMLATLSVWREFGPELMRERFID